MKNTIKIKTNYLLIAKHIIQQLLALILFLFLIFGSIVGIGLFCKAIVVLFFFGWNYF
jgi:hypothetical protein